MSSAKGLEIAAVVQVVLQIPLWFLFLQRFRRHSVNPLFTLMVGLPILAIASTIPLGFFAFSLVRTLQGRSYTLGFGLGCTISAFETGVALFYISMWHGFEVFEPEFNNSDGRYRHLTFMCLPGFVALLAIVAAARERLDVGLCLASLGGSCIHCASSCWADASKAKALQPITVTVFAAVVLAFLSHYFVSLLQDKVVRGSDQISISVFNLFAFSILLHAGVVEFGSPIMKLFSAISRPDRDDERVLAWSSVPSRPDRDDERVLARSSVPSRPGRDDEWYQAGPPPAALRDTNTAQETPSRRYRDDLLPAFPLPVSAHLSSFPDNVHDIQNFSRF